MKEESRPILLFDGVCNVCNASVNFIIQNDKEGIFRFASLQSSIGQELLERHNLPTTDFDSVVYIHNQHVFIKSTAALKVAEKLSAPWRYLAPLKFIPVAVRDFAYSIIAKNRYRWFGKKQECMLPTPEIQSRFLN